MFPRLCLLLGSVLAVLGDIAQAEDRADRTLSPYFLVCGAAPGHEQLPLKQTGAEVYVAGVIADVAVRQTYANTGQSPLEAKYVFPASTRAAVYAMSMTIGNRRVVAKIREKQQARREYQAAKSQGKSASLLEEQRPNVFTMNVANIMPGDEIIVELRYTELLVPNDGVYEFVYPTVVGPRYTGGPSTAAAPTPEQDGSEPTAPAAPPTEAAWTATPYQKAGEAPLYAFTFNAAIAAGVPIQEIHCPTHDVEIRYDNEAVARVELAAGATDGGNRDLILQYRLAGETISSGVLLYEGSAEKFFLMMAQPPRRVSPDQIPPREYLFVVDVSGSMHGFPLTVSKKLLRLLLQDLRPEDRFNVLLFAASSHVLAPASLPANAGNVKQAMRLIDGEQGGGGTELLPALKRALGMPSRAGCSRSIIIATDGYVTVEDAAFKLIEEGLGNANVFPFGIGSSVNRHLIEGMARAGRGEPFVVIDPEAAAATAKRFRDYVSAPVLTDIDITFDRFDAYDVVPRRVPDLFAQRPLIVFGKWRGELGGFIRVTGETGSGPYEETIDVLKAPPLAINQALPYLWARESIARLLARPGGPDDEGRAEVISLALGYNLLTPYTSFVAVDEVVRNPSGKAESAKQPLPMPKGVPNSAVGSVPEPETTALLAVGLAVLAFVVLRRRARLRREATVPVLSTTEHGSTEA